MIFAFPGRVLNPVTQAALEVRIAVGAIEDDMWLMPIQDASAVVDSLERHCGLLFMA